MGSVDRGRGLPSRLSWNRIAAGPQPATELAPPALPDFRALGATSGATSGRELFGCPARHSGQVVGNRVEVREFAGIHVLYVDD